MHKPGRPSFVATFIALVAAVAGSAASAEDVKQPQPSPQPAGSDAPPSPPPPVVNQGQSRAAPLPASPRPSGFVAIPYLGINSFSDAGISTGFRAGALLGGRVAEIFSFNGELTVDKVNLDAPPGASASAYMFQLGISPLFHVDTPNVRFVAGPKVGFVGSTSHISGGGLSADRRGMGWTLGLNLGAFIPLKNTTSLGILLSYATMKPLVVCASSTGVDENCTGDNLRSSEVLGLTLGAFF
jgi:hypothetical protein